MSPVSVSAETHWQLTLTAETCRGATCRKPNQAAAELFTNFGAETETEIHSISKRNEATDLQQQQEQQQYCIRCRCVRIGSSRHASTASLDRHCTYRV